MKTNYNFVQFQQIHIFHLKNILFHIYKNTQLGDIYGFKGGTNLMFFWDLPRLSVDLDFDLLINKNNFKNIDECCNYLGKLRDSLKYYLQTYKSHGDYYIIKEDGKILKSGSYRLIISHPQLVRKIKIEISTENLPVKYEFINWLGIRIQRLKLPYLTAKKLIAIYSRYLHLDKIYGRDIFDLWFILTRGFPIAENIIQIWTQDKLNNKMDLKDYLNFIKNFIDKNQTKINILSEMGDLLDNDMKNYIKNGYLLQELLKLI